MNPTEWRWTRNSACEKGEFVLPRFLTLGYLSAAMRRDGSVRAMASYRKNHRLGELVREIRADGGCWIGAAILCVIFAALLGAFATGHAHKDSPRELLGCVGLLCFAVWSFNEWRRLRRMVVYLHQQGLRYDNGTIKYAIAWEDVTSIQAQYVPGMRKKGVADEGNLVALIVAFPQGQVTLPKDLHGFHGLVAELKSRRALAACAPHEPHPARRRRIGVDGGSAPLARLKGAERVDLSPVCRARSGGSVLEMAVQIGDVRSVAPARVHVPSAPWLEAGLNGDGGTILGDLGEQAFGDFTPGLRGARFAGMVFPAREIIVREGDDSSAVHRRPPEAGPGAGGDRSTGKCFGRRRGVARRDRSGGRSFIARPRRRPRRAGQD